MSLNLNFIRWLISWKVLPTVVLIRNLARKSVDVYVCAKVLELRHTIKLIQILDGEIAEIEERIQNHMQEIDSPIESIPGISFRLAAVIEAEVGDFKRFSSPDYRLRLTNLENSRRKMQSWKNVVPAICVVHCS